jgi:hypothetical protein
VYYCSRVWFVGSKLLVDYEVEKAHLGGGVFQDEYRELVLSPQLALNDKIPNPQCAT